MKPHKVFGIGFNKTGTKTLRTCLLQLNYRHVTFRRELLIAWHQGSHEPIFKVCDENDSFEDWPFSLMYRALFDRYGDKARYILTVRKTPESWIRSLKNHALTTHPTQHSRLLTFGAPYPHGLEQRHIEAYEAHNRDVMDFFAERKSEHLLKVLCWENGDSWESLCTFLNEPVPGVPLPRENRRTGAFVRSSAYLAENERRIREQLECLGLSSPESLIA